MDTQTIEQIHQMVADKKSPEEVSRALRLAPGCQMSSSTESQWNQSQGCWESRRCATISGCDDSNNNNSYCTEWSC